MKSENKKKITVEIPGKLLNRALTYTGLGITPTIKQALELIAAGRAYESLHRLKGKVKFSLTIAQLRDDDK